MSLDPTPSLPDEMFTLTQATSTFNSKGEKVKLGAHRSRVSLKVRSEEDKDKEVTISIAAKKSLPEGTNKVRNWIRYYRYVKVKSGEGSNDKTIDLNINSLAIRLNIDKKTIIKAALDKTIEKVISDRLEQLSKNKEEVDRLLLNDLGASIYEPPSVSTINTDPEGYEQPPERQDIITPTQTQTPPTKLSQGSPAVHIEVRVADVWLATIENNPRAFVDNSGVPPKEFLEIAKELPIGEGSDDEDDEEALAEQAELLLAEKHQQVHQPEINADFSSFKGEGFEEMKRMAANLDIAALPGKSPEKQRFIELFNAKREQSAGKDMPQPTKQQEQQALNSFKTMLRAGRDKIAIWGLFNLKFDPFLLADDSELKKAFYQFFDEKIAFSSSKAAQTQPILAARKEKKTDKVASEDYWELPQKTPLEQMRQIAVLVDLFTVPKGVPVKDEFIRLFRSQQRDATREGVDKALMEPTGEQEATALHTFATLMQRGDKRGAFYVVLSQSFDPFLLPDDSLLKTAFYTLFDEIVSEPFNSTIISGKEPYLKGLFKKSDKELLFQEPLPHKSIKGAEFFGGKSDYTGETRGRGFLVYPSGAVFKGSFQIGLPFEGEVRFPEGHVFKGILANGLPSQGTLTLPDGQVAEGTFRNGMLHGWAKVTTPGVKGHENWVFENGEPTGQKMKYKGPKQPLSCEHWPIAGTADFYSGPVNASGKPEGEGIVTKSDGTTYKATFKAGHEVGAQPRPAQIKKPDIAWARVNGLKRQQKESEALLKKVKHDLQSAGEEEKESLTKKISELEETIARLAKDSEELQHRLETSGHQPPPKRTRKKNT